MLFVTTTLMNKEEAVTESRDAVVLVQVCNLNYSSHVLHKCNTCTQT